MNTLLSSLARPDDLPAVVQTVVQQAIDEQRDAVYGV